VGHLLVRFCAAITAMSPMTIADAAWCPELPDSQAATCVLSASASCRVLREAGRPAGGPRAGPAADGWLVAE